MFLLVVASPGCGAGRVRKFIQETGFPPHRDLTPDESLVEAMRTTGSAQQMGMVTDLLNRHIMVTRAQLEDRPGDMIMGYSLWEHVEVTWQPADRTATFVRGLYDGLRDALTPPDAVLELRTDFRRAATGAALLGLALTETAFNEREERLNRFIERLQAPVEQVTLETDEVDPVLAEVQGIVEALRATHNGPPTIWQKRLFRVGE